MSRAIILAVTLVELPAVDSHHVIGGDEEGLHTQSLHISRLGLPCALTVFNHHEAAHIQFVKLGLLLVVPKEVIAAIEILLRHVKWGINRHSCLKLSKFG